MSGTSEAPPPLVIGANGLTGDGRTAGGNVAGADGEVLPGWAIDDIVDAGTRMDQLGWVPATAGNISVRLSEIRIAITRSGRHKGRLTADDVMLVDADGSAVATTARPSAETRLHCQIYDLIGHAGAVVHGHSVAATVLSMLGGSGIDFAGYEVLKAFEGQRTHDVSLRLPIVDNAQDMAVLAPVIAPLLRAGTPLGYLIRGHGTYTWGPDMKIAMARMEALEFLLTCELERRKLR